MFKPGDKVWTVVQDDQVKEANLCVAPATWTGQMVRRQPVLEFSDGGCHPTPPESVFETWTGAAFFLHTLVIRHHLEGRLGRF